MVEVEFRNSFPSFPMAPTSDVDVVAVASVDVVDVVLVDVVGVSVDVSVVVVMATSMSWKTQRWLPEPKQDFYKWSAKAPVWLFFFVVVGGLTIYLGQNQNNQDIFWITPPSHTWSHSNKWRLSWGYLSTRNVSSSWWLEICVANTPQDGLALF